MCSDIDFCICRQSAWTLDVWVLLFRADKTIQLIQNAIRDAVCQYSFGRERVEESGAVLDWCRM